MAQGVPSNVRYDSSSMQSDHMNLHNAVRIVGCKIICNISYNM